MYLRFAFLSCLVSPALLTVQAACGEAPTAKPARLDFFGDPLPDGADFRIGTTRLRHHTNVVRPFENVLFSPNGKFVFSSAKGEREVRMWETVTGREVRRFPAEISDPTFSLSADGSLLALGDINEIFLYETASGKKLRTIQLERTPLDTVWITRLSFSSDGKSLTADHSGGQPDKYRLSRWDAVTGKRIETIWKSNADWPLALSADARLLATNGEDQKVRLWETASGKKVREWEVAGKAPHGHRCLLFSPDGRNIVMAGEDARIRVYERATGNEVRSWTGLLQVADSNKHKRKPLWMQFQPGSYRAPVEWLAFAPDGKTLASVDCNDVLRLWDWKSGRELRHFAGVSGPVAFSHDGKTLAAAGVDCRIRLCSTATGRDLCPFVDPGKITNVAFAPDGRVLAVGSDRGLLHLFDARIGRELKQFPGYCLFAFSPKGGRLLVRCQEGDCFGPWCLLDAATGHEDIRFRSPEEDSYCYCGGWDAEKKLLLTCGGGSARVWNTATGKIRRDIRGEKEGAERYCSPDGRTVAVTDRVANQISLFAADTGKELRPLTGYRWDVRYRACRGKASVSGGGLFRPLFSPNGKVLLAGCDLESLGLWDLSAGKQFLRLSCNQFLPHQPIFSPNSDLLCLLDPQGDTCLVDLATGRVRHRLTWTGGDLSWILESVRAFSPDGRLLAASYDPHTFVLWEVATGQPIRTWPGHGRGELRQMVFSSDGRRLATVGIDGTALVWDVTGLSPGGRLPARRLTLPETESAWRDLADKDAAKAHRAVWTLTADPERALPLLRQCLHATTNPDPRRLARLIADLDNDVFAVRESATTELRNLSALAQPALQEARKGQPSLELRRRVQGLLEELDGATLSAESLRGLRAVAVLEHMAGAEARQLLRTLSEGATGAALTREAKASLARLRSGRVQP